MKSELKSKLKSGRGLFVTLEGVDGSGKSTQSPRIASFLEELTGRRTLITFEPGGWDGGSSFRDMILNDSGIYDGDARGELFLFLADRSIHLRKVIEPALGAGMNVLCERYNDSTIAYQCGGHGLDEGFVSGVIGLCGFRRPDVTVLLEPVPDAALGRTGECPDRFEREGREFSMRVSCSYASLCESEPERFVRVSIGLSDTVDEVRVKIERGLENKLNKLREV